jgi:hypothetical protein
VTTRKIIDLDKLLHPSGAFRLWRKRQSRANGRGASMAKPAAQCVVTVVSGDEALRADVAFDDGHPVPRQTTHRHDLRAQVLGRGAGRDHEAEILAEEKAATEVRDALSAACRELPMIEVEKDYLFEGCRHLIDYHFMFRGHRCFQ